MFCEASFVNVDFCCRGVLVYNAARSHIRHDGKQGIWLRCSTARRMNGVGRRSGWALMQYWLYPLRSAVPLLQQAEFHCIGDGKLRCQSQGQSASRDPAGRI